MQDVVASFTIEENEPFEVEYNISQTENINCIFQLNAVRVFWGGIEGDISDQTDLYNELDTLSSQIDGNHQEISNIHNTIQGYGDIVSYDAADFATSIQGGLADTALQPNDNISELNNDVGYITSSSLPTVNNNTITIQKNGTDVESFTLNQNTNKSINITVPTNTNELTNGAGFITSAVNNLANYYLKSETYTKTEVQQLIASIPQFRVLVVQSLPQEGEPMVLYLVPKEGETPDVYNEYIWIEDDEDYELIGNTAIDLTDYVKFTDLATVATTGDYDDLINQPTIPTATSELTNDSGFITSTALTPYALISSLSTVATSGSYTDLSDKPTIGNGTITFTQGGVTKGTITTNQSGNTTIDFDAGGTVDQTFDGESANAQSGVAIAGELTNYLSSSNTVETNTVTLATVATSGDYGDLLNKPTIPTVNNPTITFIQGGTTKGTITLNQSSNQTITFDAGGGGAVDSVNGQTGTVVLTASDVGALPDSTTIPTMTSQLTNDSGFITNSALNGYATQSWVGQQGYITGITSSDVTTALGYTPYNATNPNGYTSNVGTVTSVNNTQPDSNGNVTITIPDTATWGNITGTLSDQTDLQNALNAKLNVSDVTEYTAAEVETLWGNI